MPLAQSIGLCPPRSPRVKRVVGPERTLGSNAEAQPALDATRSSYGWQAQRTQRKNAAPVSRTRSQESSVQWQIGDEIHGKVKGDGKRVPLDVKAGDLILFGKYTSQEVKLDGEEYLIMREDEVLAVIDGGVTAART
ncbi:MAG: hypothetical protein DMF98_18075 [Acidobacteria bacterium]|nr:MAG: hypothetical protein DMF98_18075 [Acidobacteriota bacterium]